jgi:cysteinyl-tRNA synthetase
VHHTNEIAQTEAATGKLLANWWMHGEWLNLKDRKMSKSAGGFITLQMLIDQGYDPLAYRYLTYQAHYSTQLAFTTEALDGAAEALRRLQATVAALPVPSTSSTSSTPSAPSAAPDADAMERFHDALRDNLNAPRALAAIWEVAHSAALAPGVKRATLLAMNDVMPMGLEAVQPAAAPRAAPPEVLALLERRQAARKAKDFATADALRAEIAAAGWELRDTPAGPELVRR